MHLTLLVIFGIFLRNTFHTESRKITPDGTVYEGFKVDAFRRITSHLIETNIVNTLGLCALNCVKNLECVSFNFGNAYNGKHVCELLRTDKYNSRSSYVTSTDYHYFYPGNKCMDPSPCQNNGSCYPDYDNNDYHCVCKNGTKGRNCEIAFRNCSELLQDGFNTSGVYHIYPDDQGSFPVYCDMTTDGGGWTVFQKRVSGSLSFYLQWEDYKTGFGNLNDEFWLGLDKIYRLTKRQITMLRVNLEDFNGNKGYAVYSSFAIADQSNFYRLSVSGYSGTAGDSLAYHNGMKFSTRDKDNDMSSTSCARYNDGAWWYNHCHYSNLNGLYGVAVNQRYMCWISMTFNQSIGLKHSEMKLK